jgi:hypothetical protein
MRLSFAAILACLIPSAQAQVWEKPLAPGVTYHMEVAAGPRIIHAIRFTPGSPGARLSAELAGGTINEEGTVKGRLTPTKIQAQTDAIAVINADFFSFEHGAPIGLMVRNGELITSPFKPRSVFAWGQGSGFAMPSFKATLTDTEGLSLNIDGFNQPTRQNQVGLYTTTAGQVDLSGDNVLAQISIDRPLIRPDDLVGGTVDILSSEVKRTTVPEGKVLIVARGTKASLLAALRPDRKVKIRVEVQAIDWSKFESAIGGGPMLVTGGKVSVDATAQGFAASFSDARHPRTAVGRTKEGDIWLVAIDGRQTMSIGASLREAADVMLGLGCVEAMNLDGGGSTGMNILGVTVNRPSDRIERPVSNALVLFGSTQNPSTAKASIKAPATAKPGDQFEAKFLLDGIEVPQAEVIWGMQGVGWIDQGGFAHIVENGRATLTAYARGATARVELTVAPALARPVPVVASAQEVAPVNRTAKRTVKSTVKPKVKSVKSLKVTVTATQRTTSTSKAVKKSTKKTRRRS